MTYSPEWSAFWAKNKPQPQNNANLWWLFSMFAQGRQARVLELGCGQGDNAWYWTQYADYVAGIDGSPDAIAEARGRYPECEWIVGDFTREMPVGFDVIFDRAAVSHNDREGMRRAIDLAFDALKPGGIYIGSDWFSTSHSEYDRGEVYGLDTRADFPDGQFEGVGIVNFIGQEGIGGLFTGWHPLYLQERITRLPTPLPSFPFETRFRWQSKAVEGDYISATWDVVARRPW